MRLLPQLLVGLTFLFSCTDNQEAIQSKIDEKRIAVENGLCNRVLIEGDKTWTIEERMKHYGVPGMSIAVIKDFKVHWAKTYGIKDRDTQEPVEATTLFQAGSISKSRRRQPRTRKRCKCLFEILETTRK